MWKFLLAIFCAKQSSLYISSSGGLAAGLTQSSAGYLSVGGSNISLVEGAGGALCLSPDSLPPATRLTENADGSVTALINGAEVRLGRDAAGNLTLLPGSASLGGDVKLLAACTAGPPTTIQPDDLPASLRIVANSDGTFCLEEVNSISGGRPSAPVQLVKNSDGSFTMLPPAPPPAQASAVLLAQQLKVNTDGTASMVAPPPGFELVTAPGGATFLQNSQDGTRVAVTRNKDGSLGLTASGLTQVMVASASTGVSSAGGGGSGLLEAAVYNHLHHGGPLPPGVRIEANSDGTLSVTMPPSADGSTPPIVSRIDLQSAGISGAGATSWNRHGQHGNLAALSAVDLLGLESLLSTMADGGGEGLDGTASTGQLPPGITLVRLKDGSQSVLKNGIPTGTVLLRQPNGNTSLQTSQSLLGGGGALEMLLLSGWPITAAAARAAASCSAYCTTKYSAKDSSRCSASKCLQHPAINRFRGS